MLELARLWVMALEGSLGELVVALAELEQELE
jgi:hypothetical protein